MSRKTKELVVEEFRRASIEDAAMQAIARKGIEEVTIQDIADEAGVAKGTVYVYFRDREELLARTADRLFDNLIAEIEPSFCAPGGFGVRLRGLALRQLLFFDEHKALFRATMALWQRESDPRKSRCVARYLGLLEKFFGDAVAKGDVRPDLDPFMLAAVYRDCIRGVILRRLDPNSQRLRNDAEVDAELLVSILLRGIQAGDQS
ncbi:MAG TPA: TetR/AcrR family transcriptional regulator [Thermoanaerobaculia bacterium]|nr:TetR/AcrR family transcriptional regulator [Thermoanaerobaculia bacterium]